MATRKGRTTMVATAEPEVQVQVEGAEGSAGAAGTGAEGGQQKAKRTLNGVYVQTPAEMREKIEAAAEADGKSAAGWVRDFLASHFGVEVPPTQKKTKYTSDEERKAAQTAKRMERQELIKSLLKAHKAKLAAAAQSNGQVPEGTPA